MKKTLLSAVVLLYASLSYGQSLSSYQIKDIAEDMVRISGDKMEISGLSKSSLSMEQFVNLFDKNVFEYFDLKDYNTDLKRQVFTKSDEYKRYYALLLKDREIAMSKTYYTTFRFSSYDTSSKSFPAAESVSSETFSRLDQRIIVKDGGSTGFMGLGGPWIALSYPLSKIEVYRTRGWDNYTCYQQRFSIPVADENLALELEEDKYASILFTFTPESIVKNELVQSSHGWTVTLHRKYLLCKTSNLYLINLDGHIYTSLTDKNWKTKCHKNQQIAAERARREQERLEQERLEAERKEHERKYKEEEMLISGLSNIDNARPFKAITAKPKLKVSLPTLDVTELDRAWFEHQPFRASGTYYIIPKEFANTQTNPIINEFRSQPAVCKWFLEKVVGNTTVVESPKIYMPAHDSLCLVSCKTTLSLTSMQMRVTDEPMVVSFKKDKKTGSLLVSKVKNAPAEDSERILQDLTRYMLVHETYASLPKFTISVEASKCYLNYDFRDMSATIRSMFGKQFCGYVFNIVE